MKIRWREHERIFVTLTGALVLGVYLWHVLTDRAPSFEDSEAAPFLSHHFPFGFFRNALLPEMGFGLLIYLSYLWINLQVVPRLLFPKKMAMGTARVSIGRKGISFRGMAGTLLKRLFVALGQLILIGLLLFAGFCLCAYYRNEYLFHYSGFAIFPHRGVNPNPMIDIHGDFAGVTMALFFFMICLFLREAFIALIERKGPRRPFRVMIANQVTGFLMIYLLGIPIGMGLLPVQEGGPLYVIYFALFSSVLLVFLNLYWLFPSKGDLPFSLPALVAGLLGSTFICTFPLPVFFGFGTSLPYFFLSWAFQLVIVTPVAWFFYQQGKKRIHELGGLEKALVRSKADLQFLRSQINPHFLFNALNTLYGAALLEGSERTASGIQKLGDMMRFMLHENNQDFILMDREIEYLENYIALQKLRIPAESDITIDAHIDKEIYHYRIAPMLFIPFVENAFKHGISLNERSWIKIKFSCDQRNIRFEARNSLHPRTAKDPEKENSGIGLKNVVARLKLLYAGRFEISAREEGNEFVAELAIQP